MPGVKRIMRICTFLLALSYMLISQSSSAEERHDMTAGCQHCGQVSLFMTIQEKSYVDITFELEAVNIISEDGTQREIMSAPIKVNSIELSGRQIFLGERMLPEGVYKKIQFIVKESSIKRKDRTARLALPQESIEVDINAAVSRNKNTSLFMTWNSDASVVEGFMFKPALTVKGQTPELSTLLVYVTNEDSNNVSVINMQSEEVVANIMVGKKPRGVATGLRKDNPKVYVVNSGSSSISVIDPTLNKVETEIPVRLGWGPEDIAVARVSPEKELIFVANYNSNTVSVIDGRTYQETESINVGKGPVAIAAEPPVDGILDTRFLSAENINNLRNYRQRFFNVYVANRNSKDVSVLKMDVSTGRSAEVINLNVEWGPAGLGIDYLRGKVYVANYDSDKLSVIDIIQIVKGAKSGVVSTINNIGNSGIGVASDPSFDRVYLLREIYGELVVIKPLTESIDSLRATLTPITDVITVGSLPRALLFDPESRRLYVVNRGDNNVTVIDKTTRKAVNVIPVGRKPYDLAIFRR